MPSVNELLVAQAVQLRKDIVIERARVDQKKQDYEKLKKEHEELKAEYVAVKKD